MDFEDDLLYGSQSRFWLAGSEMDMSDSMLLEMAQQQNDFQEKLSRATKQRGIIKTKLRHGGEEKGKSGEDDDKDEDDSTDPPMVVDILLPLMKDVVDFGKRCDQLHQIVARSHKNGVPDPAAGAIENLSFEVVAAVARIATSIQNKEWRVIRNRSTVKLAQTVYLIRTVRIPRISKLAATAAQHLPHNEDIKGTRNNAVLKSEEIPSSSRGRDGQQQQQQQLQEDAAAKIDNLPSLVRHEVTSALDQFQDHMGKQLQELVRDAVRRELERQQQGDEVSSLPTLESRRTGGWFGWSNG